MRNHKSLPTFILLGLTDDPPMQVLIFTLLFASYTLNVTGNLIIIIITLVDSRLKTAMCFFLKNFSFLEALFTTVCIPRFLYSLSTEDKTISYNACFSQIFFIFTFTATEFFLLAIMSYDCYVAICKPSHYATIMNSRVCGRLVICCWIADCLVIFLLASLGLELEFYDSNIIDHFVCDAFPVLKISCSDTWFLEQIVFTIAVLTVIGTFLCVFLSYTYIIEDYYKVAFGSAKMKAFSTCSSHLIVVSITYGSCIFIYVKPSAKDEVTAPMLNPFIYSPRNKQVKRAFTELIERISLISKK